MDSQAPNCNGFDADAASVAPSTRRSGSVASSYWHPRDSGDFERPSRKWRPSWMTRSVYENFVVSPSRRASTCTTTTASTASTRSSTYTTSSQALRVYELPDGCSSIDGGPSVSKPLESVSEATRALESLAMDDLEDEDYITDLSAPTQHKEFPPTQRIKSRTRSSMSLLSSAHGDDSLGLAELEMVSREYQGYWRATFTATLPPAAAICGCMLLTSRLPVRKESNTTNMEVEVAYSLCEALEEAKSPAAARQILHQYSLDAAIQALKSSFYAAEPPTIPKKTAWAIYQKISEAKNHPTKVPTLWDKIGKLLRKIPQDTLTAMLFLLSVAHRLQSRGVKVQDRSPAIFLIAGMWPKYVGDDISRLMMKHYNDLPQDLPLKLESVNYRFKGRRCNLLALFSDRAENICSDEVRPSQERDVG